MTDLSHIRNFAIIAHIDHGKSTLADRLIERCGGLTMREMRAQVLDSMDIERERGITIKAQTVRLNYTAKDGRTYQLNLMDTPGHVDFAYEVSRSLAACEGSILLVDASQGVEAQTLANAYLAIDAGHEVIPVLNKLDLPAAEPERVKEQIEEVIGIDAEGAITVSAKTGLGIDDVLEALVTRLPPPRGDATATLKCLLVDSWYDPFLGVVALVRVVDGTLRKGQRIRMMATGSAYQIDRVGVSTPARKEVVALGPGELGYLTASIKEVADCRVRRHHHRRPGAGGRAARRIQTIGAGGVLQSVPRRQRQIRGSEGQSGQAAFERRQLSHVGGILDRARLRLPLRILGPAAHGDRAGTPHARVRPRSDRHRAVGALPRAPDRRHAHGSAQSVGFSGPGAHRLYRGAVDQGVNHRARRVSGQCAGTLHRPPRRADRAVLCRQPRTSGLPAATQRGRVRLLRPAEVGQSRLCQLRLRRRGLPRRRAGQGRDHGQWRAGRRPVDDRPPQPGRAARAEPCANG